MFRSFSGNDPIHSMLFAQGLESDSSASVGNGSPFVTDLGTASRANSRLRSSAFDAGRILDVVIALAALILVAPLMLVIVVAIKLSSRGPVYFSQARLGRGGRTFSCIKFRTMRVDSEAILSVLLANDSSVRVEWERDQKLRNDPRVFAIGGLLRRTSLDELPQLFNVLIGDMSIVGPRPIIEAEAFRYRRYIADYFTVRPGITGLWQVSGRNHTTYRRRVACDVAYVRTKSASNDLRIMALTVPTVLLARGAY